MNEDGYFAVSIETWGEGPHAIDNERAITLWEHACEKAGVSHGGIAHVEILTEEYLDRENDQEPETYLGVSEVADELGVSRQRVSELRKAEGFPAPIADLAAGPVWKGSSLRRFIEGWERRPGRPRKDRAAAAS